MNISNKINTRDIYYFMVFLASACFLVFFAFRPHFSYDGFWHLKMGMDLINHGMSPWIDHYSFTHYGEEIAPVPFIFQILLAVFVSVFGEVYGFQFLKIFYAFFLLLCLHLFFRKIKAPWFIVFLVLPFITYFVHLRYFIRPEIISYVLIVICINLYIRAREDFGAKEMLAICFVIFFWVNYHSPIFGYIIFFGFFLDRAIHKIFHKNESYTWNQWMLWGGTLFMIGFLKPSGPHVLIETLSLLNSEFGKYTLEYSPSNTLYSMDKIVYFSWVLAFYITVASFLKKQYGFAFITIFLVYFSWSTLRLVVPVAIVHFCVLAYLLSQIAYSWKDLTLDKPIKRVLVLFSAGLSVMAFYTLVRVAEADIKNRPHELQTLEQRYPRLVADYLESFQDGGNMLNSMGLGGFLLYKLAPDFKVFIDGRTNILYPIEFVKINNPIEFTTYEDDYVHVKSDALSNIMKKYDIQYAVYKNTPEKLMSFYGVDKFELNYADENYLLFSEKKEISFPVSSQLMVLPMCWNESLSDVVKREVALSEELFADKSYALKYLLRFLDQYISASDKSKYLSELEPGKLKNDSSKRVAAYISMQQKNYEKSIKYFLSYKLHNEYDLLMIAYSLINLEKYSMAEEFLYHFYTKNKGPTKITVAYQKIAIFKSLLENINEKSNLVKFSPDYIKELDGKLKDGNFNNGKPIDSIIPYQYVCKTIINR